MHTHFRRAAARAFVFGLLAVPLEAQTISPSEQRLRDWIATHREEQVGLLQRLVDVASGSLNVAGVRAVGALYRAELDGLGFSTRWAEMPSAMQRAGHLVAHRPARIRPGTAKKFLLIGHFDTVFEGAGQKFVREDSIARGAGTADMKGGDVILVYALKALAAGGQLDAMDVTVVITGDEESTGRPLAVARQDLIEAAKAADLALSFEGGSRDLASITRRGASGWVLSVTGRQAHSAGVFGGNYGAIYEAARILNEFRVRLVGQPGLTFNPGLIAGGTTAEGDSTGYTFLVHGKTNIISPTTVVKGDLRFLTEAQKERARGVMRQIVARHLPGTDATITFDDSYPAMPLTQGGQAILAQYDTVSRALGYPAVRAQDANRRGAGDLSFVAPYIPGMDGLGALGGGSHSPAEWVNLPTLTMQTARAAVLMARLAGLRK